jgi:acetolactate synthase I/II/III large subunit
MIVADFIAEYLVVRLGVRHVFGVGGANIEDMFAAVQRRRPELRAVLSKHEHAAGTAADAYARLSGGIGVVLATSGGGAMNLVHSIAEARASRVPLLAIVGEPPTDVQGVGAFQDTSGRGGAIDAAALFGSVSVWCRRVERAADVPRLLAEATNAALGAQPGPAVLLVAKDRQRSELSVTGNVGDVVGPPPPRSPNPATLQKVAALLRSGAVMIVAGDEVARAGAQPELAAVAELLDAEVAVAPDARDAFDNYSPRFLGPSGAMGTSSVARSLASAAVCLVVGTRLPLLARQGLEALLAEKPLVSLGRERPFVTSAAGQHVEGDLLPALRALRAELGELTFARVPAETRNEPPRALAAVTDKLNARSALAAVERALPVSGVAIVDAGNTGATAVHHLRVPRGCRWLIAMGMAGMGYSFGAAIGAAFATGKRCTVLAGDGAFFMNGLDVHTAVEHQLPITYVIFDNSAHGMCLVRERLLLGENAGYNSFRRSRIGAGLSAMFPGLAAYDCQSPQQLEQALAQAAHGRGPSLISVELEDVEIPPFAVFQRLSSSATVSRGGERAGA